MSKEFDSMGDKPAEEGDVKVPRFSIIREHQREGNNGELQEKKEEGT